MKLEKIDLYISVFIIIYTFAIYAQVLNYNFVNYDDDGYVYQNPMVT